MDVSSNKRTIPLAVVDADEARSARGPEPLSRAVVDHHDWLTALLARRYGRDEAADIAQETWLRVQAYTPAGPVRSVRALLARVALNLAANRVRKQARETLYEPADLEGLGPALAPSQEQAVFFEQMMLALPPKLRDVFVLNHIRGLTYREIAAMRGISVKAVEKRMSQAIALCAEMARG